MMNCGYFDATRNGSHFSFDTNSGWWATPLPSEICAESDPPPSRNADFDRFPLNVSTVRDSEKSSVITNIKSTTCFPVSYRWSAYVTPKSPKGGSKSVFPLFLWIKVNFSWIKSATKFLCVKTSSSKVAVQPFPYLSLHRYWREQ